MGLVDENNKVNFYDGKVRVVDPEGTEFVKFEGKDYLSHLAEHVEPYSYLVYPYLKGVGWKGFVDGKESGVYRAAPLARCNAADGMATPLAQQAYEHMYSTLGGKPVHATLATHWARLVELQYAAERALEIASDPDITSTDIRNIPTGVVGEGVGVVEAPRGTLYHHYKTDQNGIVTNVNLIVGTTNNNAAISMSLKKAAEGLIKPGGEISEGLLNQVEMAFRAYDPCFGCATHTLYGEMPLEVTVRDQRQRRGAQHGPEVHVGVSEPQRLRRAHRRRRCGHALRGVMPERTLVLGMGNPILSDDGFGLVVAERLRALPLPDGVEVMQSEVAGLRLLELMRGFDKVIIVDALKSGRTPGDIVRFEGKDFRGGHRYGSAHSIGLATALELGEKLGYEMPARDRRLRRGGRGRGDVRRAALRAGRPPPATSRRAQTACSVRQLGGADAA